MSECSRLTSIQGIFEDLLSLSVYGLRIGVHLLVGTKPDPSLVG